jgi:hypothetical protein
MARESTEDVATDAAPGSGDQDDATPADIRRERGRVMSFLNALFPLLTAVLTFVGTLLGLWYPTNNERNDLTEQVEGLRAEVNTLRADNVELEGALQERDEINEIQQAEIDDLRNAGPPGVEGGSSLAVDGDRIGVFRSTENEPLTIPRGYSIDLDSRADNWGISNSTGQGLALTETPDGLRFFVASRTIALMDGEATYDDCNSTTQLTESLSADHMVIGQQFCAQTRQGRWALVTIVDLDHDLQEAAVDIIVWNLDAG